MVLARRASPYFALTDCFPEDHFGRPLDGRERGAVLGPVFRAP